MSQRYQAIIDKIDSIKTDISDILEHQGFTDEELAQLTNDQIEALISHYNNYCSPNYQQLRDMSDALKTRYLELPTLQESDQLIETVLKWGKTMSFNNNINKYRSNIIKYLLSLKGKGDSTRVYKTIWLTIIENKLFFNNTHVKDLAAENPEFIEYIIKSNSTNIPKAKKITKEITKDSDDTDYYTEDDDMCCGNNNIEMTYAESFIVSLFLSTDKFDHHMQDLLTMYKNVCHPMLKHFPMKVTRFEGEILAPILAHYTNTIISPIVKYRHTVGIVLNNKPYEFYKYEDICKARNSSTKLYTNSLSIEFPYMCYVSISHIEIETDSEIRTVSFGENEKPRKLTACVESDYVLKPFKPLKEEQHQCETETNPAFIERIECTNPEKPGIYTSVYFSLIGTFIYLRNIRIYGQAISFV
jgi:hypothetical protein